MSNELNIISSRWKWPDEEYLCKLQTVFAQFNTKLLLFLTAYSNGFSRNEYAYTLVQCKWIKGGSLVFWLDSYCWTYHNHSLLMSQLRRTFDNILVNVSRWSIASLKRQIQNIFDYYARFKLDQQIFGSRFKVKKKKLYNVAVDVYLSDFHAHQLTHSNDISL